VRRTTGRDDLFVVGHSLGGLLTYAAAPLASALVRGIVTIGSPYQFTRGSAVLRVLAGLLWTLDRAGLTVGNLGNVPLPLRMIGAALRMSRLYVESPLYPLRLRGWHAGSIEPEILAEHMRLAFDVANLPVMLTMFRWSTSGGGLFGGTHETGESYAERFERCALPLLVIAGTEDDLAPPASVEPAYIRSRSPDKAYRELPLGHIDLLVGRDAPRSTWPMVERWVGERAARLSGTEHPAATGWAGYEDVP
jgi:polyhydroxyalkanoate synthase